VTELDALIAVLNPQAEKVPDLETSTTALVAEKGTLEVYPFFICSLQTRVEELVAEVITLKVEGSKVEGLINERNVLSKDKEELIVWLLNSSLMVDACQRSRN
jgi:hypothetical protein